MIDPGMALGVFAIVVAVAALVVWPRVGLLARLKRRSGSTERIRIEDTLKHLLNCELAERRATADSLAGVLQINRGDAHRLLEQLGERGFARLDDLGVALTTEGRTYAVRVLRSHRLLERYFADRTGVAPGEWHDLAEAREHSLTEAEVESLSARMGHPALDPHGDPIPTARGELPPRLGVPLSALSPGEAATIVHVEDEPVTVFQRLLALGVNPAVPVKMVRVGPDAVEVLVGGVSRRLDPLVAAAVTVERVVELAGHTVLFERLDALEAGQLAEVVQIAPSVQGPQRRRLLDLGILPGTPIAAEFRSPAGDPMAYRVRGALIALRRPQAQGIYIRRTAAGLGVSA
jgi:DtxR family Mn-dependent transcriptional regulator